MTYITDHIQSMRRPKLLLQAVAMTLETSDADQLTAQVLGETNPTCAKARLDLLMMLENRQEAARKANAGYSAQRHIMLLCALLNEAKAAQSRKPVFKLVS